MSYVAYYRLSTKCQGQSGLGLDSQRETVVRFLKAGNVLLGEFIEEESGKRNDQPELEAAISYANQHRAQLLIANSIVSPAMRVLYLLYGTARWISSP